MYYIKTQSLLFLSNLKLCTNIFTACGVRKMDIVVPAEKRGHRSTISCGRLYRT